MLVLEGRSADVVWHYDDYVFEQRMPLCNGGMAPPRDPARCQDDSKDRCRAHKMQSTSESSDSQKEGSVPPKRDGDDWSFPGLSEIQPLCPLSLFDCRFIAQNMLVG